MVEKIHQASAYQNPETAKSPARTRSDLDNLDLVSTGAFITAGLIGLIGAVNNIRLTFWNTFVMGTLSSSTTPFTKIRDAYRSRFSQLPKDYEAGRITADEYRGSLHTIAKEFRTEAEAKLLKEFNIPTNGVSGWTVGTWKRFQELRRNDRYASFVGFATVGAITVGAITLLRHNKHTLDRVEDKIDASAPAR